MSVLVTHNNKILLGKRLGEPGKGRWALPSGYIEFEDDFLSAAIREVKEETGLDIEIVSILTMSHPLYTGRFGCTPPYIAHCCHHYI